jgi:hypothetical protein
VRTKLTIWILSLLFSLPLTVLPCQPQMTGRPPQRIGDPANNPPEGDETRDRMEAERLKKANLARQAQLKSDTDKLVKLAGELKDYVDKSNADVLSLDVVKKADEIEKLAKSVKEKMRGTN